MNHITYRDTVVGRVGVSDGVYVAEVVTVVAQCAACPAVLPPSELYRSRHDGERRCRRCHRNHTCRVSRRKRREGG